MPHPRLYQFLLFLLLLAAPALAQVQTISGTVRDAQTNEKLAFVSIAANNGETGTTTNLEGQYTLRHNRPITSVRFSYVGYTPQQVAPDSSGRLNIYLRPAAARLQEVVIRSGENPAHRIIQLAYQNREQNRTDNLAAYTYRTYNKFIFTATGDRDIDMSDTLQLTRRDSSFIKMQNLVARQHLFLSESITDYAFLAPNRIKETILATRVSGLEQPSFGIVAAEARNFSVYTDMADFFGKHYLSPLSTGSIRKYDFQLEETNVVGRDTVFVISFKPQRGRNFDGLNGILYINSDGWAVQNIIAESSSDEKRGLKLQQQFTKVNGQRWFPSELDVEIFIPQLTLRGHQPMGYIRTYVTNVNLNPSLRKRDFGAIALNQIPQAHRQPDSFWQQQRADTLSQRDRLTYQRLDSLGKTENLDGTIRTMEYLLSGQIPVGIISLDMNRLLRVNRFEDTRLGIGAHTNDMLSDRFRVGGYWGYGFGDKSHKYGADASYVFHKPSELRMQLEFAEDVLEPGGRRMPFRNRSLLSDFRPVLLDYLDYSTQYTAGLAGRFTRFLQAQVMVRKEERRPNLFSPVDGAPAAHYNVTEAVVSMRYAYGEYVTKLFNQTIAQPSDYPVIWLQYTRGLDGVLAGDYVYNKYDMRLITSFRHRTTGETSFTWNGGYVQGNAPPVTLYNGFGSYNATYTVYAGEGFETMGPYEFFLDRYASVFFKQNFGKRLLRTRFFQPNIAVITNIGFGDLNQSLPPQRTLRFDNMRQGFFESGLLLNDIISSPFTGLGAGVFYRYGPYALPDNSDNLAFKLTLTIAI